MFAGLSVQIFAQDPRPVPIEYLRPMKNSVSIGVRAVGGAKVKFSGNLGGGLRQLSQLTTDGQSFGTGFFGGNGDLPVVLPESVVLGGYSYPLDQISVFDNGSILRDSSGAASPRPADPADPNVADTQMRNDGSGSWYRGKVSNPSDPHYGMLQYDIYTLDSSGNTIPDAHTGQPVKTTKYYLPYDANYSRNWSINSREHQYNAADNQVTYGRYWTESAGNEIELEDGSNPGVEFKFERIVQRFKRFEWGLAATAGISEFNAKTRRGITVNLRGYEYTYNLSRPLPDDGSTGGPTYSADETEETTAAIGIKPNGYDEDTDKPENNYQAGGTAVDRTVDVNGYWQVKGVYYLYRVGPFIRIPITRQFSISASAGYMGAYVGSKFRYEETMTIPEVSAAYTTGDVVKNNQRYVSGYYGDLNIEWWLSTRTGFYVGAAYEKLGDYTQIHDERRVDVKMDGGAGFRFGIITRF
ncbi:hypothetical protein AW736_20870 [Termitidicoccus mucosus]|uniref:Uncharacterized protein n=2 Tax=Termitidicoccus mucosus TaxID=1184151 RepID=A0A178ICG6_9BACT|nr:hypothetical protein AW736_20870 [Opitutaceae bacterium TSB47]